MCARVNAGRGIMKVSYSEVSALGGDRPERHLAIMRIMTSVLFPVVRFRGLDFLARNVARLVAAEDVFTRVRLTADTWFTYPTYDSYWGAHVLRGIPYEPALSIFISRVAANDFAFIDCGANFGYWSALLSGRDLGSHQCIAVEGSPQTFSGLRRTAGLNGDRFHCLNRVVWSQSGEPVRFMEGGRHAGRHVSESGIDAHPANLRGLLTPAEHPVRVATISLEDAARRIAHHSFLVKIDVEGSEIQAFAGAGAIADRDTVFVYEDHGADVSHRVTRKLIECGYRVGYPNVDGTVQAIAELEHLDRIKKNRRHGYDFIASRGSGPLTDAAWAAAHCPAR